VIRLWQVMTLTSGSPSVGPTSTSERMRRIVRVIGAQVTAVSTSDGCIPGEDAHRSATGRFAEVGPDDVAARYH
jgi:hypothetical protein